MAPDYSTSSYSSFNMLRIARDLQKFLLHVTKEHMGRTWTNSQISRFQIINRICLTKLLLANLGSANWHFVGRGFVNFLSYTLRRMLPDFTGVFVDIPPKDLLTVYKYLSVSLVPNGKHMCCDVLWSTEKYFGTTCQEIRVEPFVRKKKVEVFCRKPSTTCWTLRSFLFCSWI